MTVTVRTQRATNPNVATAATNWAAVAGTGGTATGARNTGAGYDGAAGFFRTSWTAATTALSGGATYTQTGLSASTAYTHSMYVRSSKTQTAALTLQYKNSSSTNVGSAVTGTAVALTAATWARISVTGTSGSGVDRVVLTAAATTGGAFWANGDTFDFDCVLIETGSTLQAYFDGSYVDGLGVDYAWTGTADASTSTATTYQPTLTLTALSDAPCDRVQIQITDMQPSATNNVTLWRTADGVRRSVRGYRKINVIGSDSTVDYEVPLQRLVTYELEYVSGPAFNGPASTATITVDASSGWIQDPLDPTTAQRINGTDTHGGTPTLLPEALKAFQMAAGVNMVDILGSNEPVALMGERMASSGVSFAMMTNAAQSATDLRTLLKQTPLLLIRPVAAWAGALPGLCYTAAPTPVEIPVTEAWGGTLIHWKFESGLVAPSSMDIVIPLWTYGDWQALWTTYQQAQTTLSGKTYLQVKERPATG